MQPDARGAAEQALAAWPASTPMLGFRLRTAVRFCGDAWSRQGLAAWEREPRCRQASLNRRQNEVTANKQPALALAA